ncbi:hypothetical protein [Leptospira perolatii]|uniref:hypothetical protein n=1 Tax=Leptospira perolatii TaxID=2023191 RepID=UPI000F63FBD6|nr:hypothetical protein [Leptospira perolatii]
MKSLIFISVSLVLLGFTLNCEDKEDKNAQGQNLTGFLKTLYTVQCTEDSLKNYVLSANKQKVTFAAGWNADADYFESKFFFSAASLVQDENIVIDFTNASFAPSGSFNPDGNFVTAFVGSSCSALSGRAYTLYCYSYDSGNPNKWKCKIDLRSYSNPPSLHQGFIFGISVQTPAYSEIKDVIFYKE